eukprot:scaffold351_cov248-Pinguiococcus_pyrenoidosus.AAC.1
MKVSKVSPASAPASPTGRERPFLQRQQEDVDGFVTEVKKSTRAKLLRSSSRHNECSSAMPRASDHPS